MFLFADSCTGILGDENCCDLDSPCKVQNFFQFSALKNSESALAFFVNQLNYFTISYILQYIIWKSSERQHWHLLIWTWMYGYEQEVPLYIYLIYS